LRRGGGFIGGLSAAADKVATAVKCALLSRGGY
jgi:hypothetical protein